MEYNYIDSQIREHMHDGNLSQRINLYDIFGFIDTSTEIPTGAPSNIYGQFKIYNGALYFYDFLNNVWSSSGGSLFDHYATVGNSGTSETDLYSDTIVANTLNVNGDKLEIEYAGSFVSSGTATRQIKIYFGGVNIFDTGALTLSLSSAWTAYVTLIRASSSAVRYMVSLTTQGAALAAYTSVGIITTTTTLTSGINSSVTSIPVASGTNLVNGDYIGIDSEILKISSGGGTTTLTATRGQLGTTAASHSNGATVTRLIPFNANTLKITGTAAGAGAASNDITAVLGSVKKIPAA